MQGCAGVCGCVGVWVRGCVGVWVCGCGCVCVWVCLFFSYTPFLCAEKFRARLVILMMTALREGTLLPLAHLKHAVAQKFKRLRKLL